MQASEAISLEMVRRWEKDPVTLKFKQAIKDGIAKCQIELLSPFVAQLNNEQLVRFVTRQHAIMEAGDRIVNFNTTELVEEENVKQ